MVQTTSPPDDANVDAIDTPPAPAEDDLTIPQHRSKQSEAVRVAVTPWFSAADAVMYVLIGAVFLCAGAGMLGYAVISFAQHIGKGEGFAEAVVALINDLLLVLIIMEVLRTILSYLEERAGSLRPFLFIGAISATRRILAVGAEMSIHGEEFNAEQFNRRLFDLGVNAGIILAIGLVIFMLAYQGKDQ